MKYNLHHRIIVNFKRNELKINFVRKDFDYSFLIFKLQTENY